MFALAKNSYETNAVQFTALRDRSSSSSGFIQICAPPSTAMLLQQVALMSGTLPGSSLKTWPLPPRRKRFALPWPAQNRPGCSTGWLTTRLCSQYFDERLFTPPALSGSFRYLEYTLNPRLIRKQDATSTIVYIAGNVVGQPLAWDFIRARWEYIFNQWVQSVGSLIKNNHKTNTH